MSEIIMTRLAQEKMERLVIYVISLLIVAFTLGFVCGKVYAIVMRFL